VVCVLVNPQLYDGISASLTQWVSDLESEGWNVAIYVSSFPDPSALRSHLGSIANLNGCLLIGDFPVPWYEVGDKQFPFDIYYMDLNGIWSDSDLNGLYDSHTGDTGPEIWIGRLLASNLDFGDDEATLVNNYFAKNHAYRTGSHILPSRALLYLDDDWAYAADALGDYVSQLYSNTTVISDANTTTALDYSQRLTNYYAWVHIFAHSTADSHIFSYLDGDGPEAIFNLDIYKLDPHGYFFNLFACGVGRFVEPNYLAGWYTFSDTYAVMTLASTTSGGMKNGNRFFYDQLAQRMSIGSAFQNWFKAYGFLDPSWTYGLVLLGDPTLTVRTEEVAGIAPTDVEITGPTTGTTRDTHSFTGIVDSGTPPFRYTWQADDQIPWSKNGGQTDAIAYSWWNNPGTKTITVTVRNFTGIVTDNYTIAINTPDIEVEPKIYYETLPLGATLTRSLTISNTGPGSLFFELNEADDIPLPGHNPDSFGYTYKDSNELDGPTFNWIEIAAPAGGGGTKVDLPTIWQGGYSWPIPLPFVFNFYGIDYAAIAINSHGGLGFVDRNIGRENLAIPSPRTFALETFIAPFWDFLVIDPGAVYYQAFDSMFIIEYYQVSRYGGLDGTWEAILFESGNILFQYQDVDFAYYWGNKGRSATVGLQGDAISGLQYSYNTPALSDGLSICFAYPGQLSDCSIYTEVSWLSENPIAGIVQPNSVESLVLVFDTAAIKVTGPNEYQSTLVIASNDPDENLVTVPVTMLVSAPQRQNQFLPLILK
jgi:hypothetical protein